MKERSIIFRGDGIQGILEGRKTQTRRIVKPQPCAWVERITIDKQNNACILHGHEMGMKAATHGFEGQPVIFCPYKPGDRLWVRETWSTWMTSTDKFEKDKRCVWYKATPPNFGKEKTFKWKPSIHMPRWASRITLEITDVRVERVQEISKEDCKAEGIGNLVMFPEATQNQWINAYRRQFCKLWTSIHGKDAWKKNEWVWVITFRRIKP